MSGHRNSANNKNYTHWHMERGCVYRDDRNENFPPPCTESNAVAGSYCEVNIPNLYRQQVYGRYEKCTGADKCNKQKLSEITVQNPKYTVPLVDSLKCQQCISKGICSNNIR